MYVKTDDKFREENCRGFTVLGEISGVMRIVLRQLIAGLGFYFIIKRSVIMNKLVSK